MFFFCALLSLFFVFRYLRPVWNEVKQCTHRIKGGCMRKIMNVAFGSYFLWPYRNDIIYIKLCVCAYKNLFIFLNHDLYYVWYTEKNHTSSIKMPLTATWNDHIMNNLRAIGTSEHHMSTDGMRTSKNVATKNQCYLDVIFMTSDRRVLSDVVRTLVSGRRRRNLYTTNARRRVPTG
jgi:hypothetical protein